VAVLFVSNWCDSDGGMSLSWLSDCFRSRWVRSVANKQHGRCVHKKYPIKTPKCSSSSSGCGGSSSSSSSGGGCSGGGDRSSGGSGGGSSSGSSNTVVELVVVSNDNISSGSCGGSSIRCTLKQHY
jgi:hypothetical protein